MDRDLVHTGNGGSVMVKPVLPPLDAVLCIVNPTQEQRLLQHARRLEIALDTLNIEEAVREFHLMMRIFHELHDTK